jgi:hypothetical protein
MSKRYQNSHLRCTKPKSGLQCCEFLLRECDESGKRTRRTIVIGTLTKLPTEQLARVAANEVRCISIPITTVVVQCRSQWAI